MTTTLSELAIHVPASIEVFEKYDFDYYQNGNQTFEEACKEKGLNHVEIDKELNNLERSLKISYELTLEDLSVDRLIDFINGHHHDNEAEILNYLEEEIKKLSRSNALDNELKKILGDLQLKFVDLKRKLVLHCEKEDKIIFPYMRRLYELRHDKTLSGNLKRNLSVKEPLLLLISEHNQVIKLLNIIKKITNKFNVPENAPNEYQKLMTNMKEFERDFHIHLHIENNILFPKFKTLEENLFNRTIQ